MYHLLSDRLHNTCHPGLAEGTPGFYLADVELCVFLRVTIFSRRPCNGCQPGPLETAHGLCGADVEFCVFDNIANVGGFGDCVRDWEREAASEEGVSEGQDEEYLQLHIDDPLVVDPYVILALVVVTVLANVRGNICK